MDVKHVDVSVLGIESTSSNLCINSWKHLWLAVESFIYDQLGCVQNQMCTLLVTVYKLDSLAAHAFVVSLQAAVITKTEEDDISTQYMLDFKGKIVSQKPSHLGQGKALIF